MAMLYEYKTEYDIVNRLQSCAVKHNKTPELEILLNAAANEIQRLRNELVKEFAK